MDDVVPARGSLRSRGAAAVCALTVRPVTGLVPPERAWGMWLSRQLIARIMGTFGPPLTGTRVEQVDSTMPDGRRVKGEWVYGPRTPTGPTACSSTGAGPMRDGTSRDHARSSGAVYYVHGSGFTMCSPRTHRRMVSWLSS